VKDLALADARNFQGGKVKQKLARAGTVKPWYRRFTHVEYDKFSAQVWRLHLPLLSQSESIFLQIMANLSSNYNKTGRCHKRQKPHAPTQQAPIRNRQMRKVANA